MIYDQILDVHDLQPGSSPLLAKLGPGTPYYYAEQEVYASRYYAGKQANSKIVKLVCVPRSMDEPPITSDQYVSLTGYEGRHIYKIDQAQYGYDDNGLPCTTLSLTEPEGKYALFED